MKVGATATTLTHAGVTDKPTVLGSGGADTITAAKPASGAIAHPPDGGAGNDTITGSAGADVIFGAIGYDLLVGGDGGDVIDGGAYDDVIEGGVGADYMSGGDGKDTPSYAHSAARVSVDLEYGTAALGDAQSDAFDTVENVTGSAFNGDLAGDGTQNDLNGRAGDLVARALRRFDPRGERPHLDASAAASGNDDFAWIGTGDLHGRGAGALHPSRRTGSRWRCAARRASRRARSCRSG